MATSLRELKSFGDVAAEDDAVLDYFLATDAVAQIEENQAFLFSPQGLWKDGDRKAFH